MMLTTSRSDVLTPNRHNPMIKKENSLIFSTLFVMLATIMKMSAFAQKNIPVSREDKLKNRLPYMGMATSKKATAQKDIKKPIETRRMKSISHRSVFTSESTTSKSKNKGKSFFRHNKPS